MRDILGLMLMNLNEMLPGDAIYYIPKDECVKRLRKWSGSDFGNDVAAWEAWIDRYRKGLETANRPEGDLLSPST